MGAVDVLWTAGWDSTFRVADLLLNQNAVVRPWYAVDRHRRSAVTELAAQDRIRNSLAELDPGAAGRLLPTEIVEAGDVPPVPEISAAFRQLRSERFLGDQYEWLARLAQHRQLTLELSIHRDDRARDALAGEVERDGTTYRLVSRPGNPALEVFRQFRFPLFDTTKLDMENAARRKGFSAIMEQTWFCHFPLRGQPCGYCNPCNYTRDEGLGRRVPPRTLHRQIEVGLLEAWWILRQAGQRFRRQP